jgi:hypothetical protein
MSSGRAFAVDRYVVSFSVILGVGTAQWKAVDGIDDQTDNCETRQQGPDVVV